MTNTVEPITDENRKAIKKWANSIGPEVCEWLDAYEARLLVVEEENKRLREVLRPFYTERAGYDPLLDGPTSDACGVDVSVWFSITMGHLRAVRDALSKGKDDHEQAQNATNAHGPDLFGD